MTAEVRAVETGRDLRLFRDLPGALNGGDPSFIPMLRAAFGAIFDRKRNPFWRGARSREWLALRDGRAVGRIGACADPELHASAHGTGAVGFFDCIDDATLAAALFDRAQEWLRSEGCTRARGPLNYTIHDTAGLLVEGHDTPPTVDTTWNPSYYGRLWETAGWDGAQDMIASCGPISRDRVDRMDRVAALARKRGVQVRALRMKEFGAEIERIRVVYNSAWADNWGHVPISAEDWAYKAKDMKAVFDPDLVRIAEVKGEPVGFYLGLPDLNVEIRKSGGRLFPFGWWGLLRARHRVDRMRIVALGVVPQRRIRGIETLLLSDSYRTAGWRYTWAEASWVLADNTAMVNGLMKFELTPYKRWRLYERAL